MVRLIEIVTHCDGLSALLKEGASAVDRPYRRRDKDEYKYYSYEEAMDYLSDEMDLAKRQHALCMSTEAQFNKRMKRIAAGQEELTRHHRNNRRKLR